MNPVKHIRISKGMNTDELISEFFNSGVMGAGRIAKAVEITTEMFKDKECAIFLGIAGAMVPGGMKDIIHDLLESGKIKAFVTTGAMLTHDMIEALGYSHYHGSADVNDAELHKKNIDRIYDSFMPNEVYEGLENFFKKNWEILSMQKMNIREFLWKIGELIPSDKKSKSILKICFEKKIPVFCPAIADSGIGLMIWGNIAQGKKIDVQAFDDLKEIISIAWDSKKNGVFYVGGGVPKNYIQQAMQFSKGADYGVQITTDRPEFGGSSGAELREGISWGKMSEKGNFIDVYCDATIALPLIWAGVKGRI